MAENIKSLTPIRSTPSTTSSRISVERARIIASICTKARMAYLLPPIDAKDLPLIVESWAEILAEIPDGALQGCYISAMLEKVSAAGVKPGALRALDVLSCWKRQIEADSIEARMVILQEEKNREDLETVRYIVAFLKISHSHDTRYGMNELRADVQQRCQNARI